MGLQIRVERVLVADHGGTAGRDNHRLGFAVEQRRDVVHKMFDNQRGLLHHVRRVQALPPGNRATGAPLVHEPVRRVLLGKPVGGLVWHVPGKRVDDVPLLDGLAHRIPVERSGDIPSVVVDPASGTPEQCHGLGLRGRGEREERHVGGHRVRGLYAREVFGHHVLVRGVRIVQVPGDGELELVGGHVQCALQRGRAAALLRGMCLVDDDREIPSGQSRVRGNHRPRVQERLQGDHDDLAPVGQGLGDLTALRRVRCATPLRVGADFGHVAGDVLQLADGLLDIAVEAETVGHHDHAGEHATALHITHVRELVRGPCDRLRLATAGRMFNQVALPRSVGAHVREHAGHGVPLVETGEYLGAPLPHTAGRVLLLGDLLEHERLEDVQPVVALEDLRPEVGGPVVAVFGGRVARMPVLRAPVERQEARGIARKVRAHPYFVLADREVHDRATLVLQQVVAASGARFDRLAFGPILLDRVLDRLGELGLHLARGYGNAVDEEHEVQRLVALGLVVHLPHDPQDVRVIVTPRVLDARIRRIGGGPLDGLEAGVREPVADYADRAVRLQRPHQPQTQVVLPVCALHAFHLLQLLRDGGPLELDEIRPAQRGLRVESLVRVAHLPAGTIHAREHARHVLLEMDLPVQVVVDAHSVSFVQSIRPVTAAWIRLRRYSSNLVMIWF